MKTKLIVEAKKKNNDTLAAVKEIFHLLHHCQRNRTKERYFTFLTLM